MKTGVSNFHICVFSILLLSILTILFITKKSNEGFSNHINSINTEHDRIDAPLKQTSYSIPSDSRAMVFWKANIDVKHPVNYFIIQYYNPVGESGIIHTKLVPSVQDQSEYSVVIDNLKNKQQFVIQVVGVNKKGLGQIEEGNFIIPMESTESGGVLIE